MSLYQMQKLLYELNREEETRRRFGTDSAAVLDRYDLTAEERGAFVSRDVGLLYVLGGHPSLLIHYAGLVGIPLTKHRETLLAGVKRHGPVRAGLMAGVPD